MHHPTPEELLAARTARGLGRAELAELTGVSERTILRAEQGAKLTPRSLEPLARFLKIGEYREHGPLLTEATDAEFAEELLRRLNRRSTDASPREPTRLRLAPPASDQPVKQAARRRRPVRDQSPADKPD